MGELGEAVPEAASPRSAFPQPGDLLSLGRGVPTEYRQCAAVVTESANGHCTVAVLDRERRVGVGECWPCYEDCNIIDTRWRLGLNVVVEGLRGSSAPRLNGNLGVICQHPEAGHPCFISKSSSPELARLTLCVRILATQEMVLLEPRFLVSPESMVGTGSPQTTVVSEREAVMMHEACVELENACTAQRRINLDENEVILSLVGEQKFNDRAEDAAETEVCVGVPHRVHSLGDGDRFHWRSFDAFPVTLKPSGRQTTCRFQDVSKLDKALKKAGIFVPLPLPPKGHGVLKPPSSERARDLENYLNALLRTEACESLEIQRFFGVPLVP